MPKRIPIYINTHRSETVLAVVLAICVLFAFAAISIAVNEKSATASEDRVRLCVFSNNTNRTLRDILLLAQRLGESSSSDRTKQQRAAADRFYTIALERVAPVDCTTFR